MKSEYDNLLMWPFRKGIRMRLINQVDGEEDIIESFESNINPSSFMKPKRDIYIAPVVLYLSAKRNFVMTVLLKIILYLLI